MAAFDSGLTEIKLANRALRHVGARVQIAALSATDTDEAILCNDFFLEARDRLLREVDWPFASKFVALADKVDGLDRAGDDTNLEAPWVRFWAFSYAYPDDCLALREFVTTLGRVPAANLPHDIITDALYGTTATYGPLRIVTDLDSADDPVIVRYSYRNTTYSTWPVDAGSAFSLLLASLICKPLTGDDEKSRKLLQEYELFRNKATAGARNDQQPDDDVDGPFLRARD